MLRASEDDAAGPTEAIAHEACAALALEDEAAEGDELFQPVVAFEELRPEREEQAPQPELAMGGSELEGDAPMLESQVGHHEWHDDDLLSPMLEAIMEEEGFTAGIAASAPVQAAASQPAQRPEPAASPEEQALLDPSFWGPFRITPKQAHTSPPHGGFQAQCRWHAKSAKTGCKTFLGSGLRLQKRSCTASMPSGIGATAPSPLSASGIMWVGLQTFCLMCLSSMRSV